MIKQTGSTYKEAQYGSPLFATAPKVGKSCFLVASALGVLPWQKEGGVVDRPENLHIVTADEDALGGIRKFLELCDAPPEALNFHVYNLQDDVRKVQLGADGWDFSLINTLQQVYQDIGAKTGSGVPVVLTSSITGFAAALKRALAGRSQKKGAGMDQSKWDTLGSHMLDMRAAAQNPNWHCWWEGHMHTEPPDENGDREERLILQGTAGKSFAYNVSHVFKIHRFFGKKYTNKETGKQSPVEEVCINTRPTVNFVSNGRRVTETLAPQEFDLAVTMRKLGFKVGNWGHKSAPVKAGAT